MMNLSERIESQDVWDIPDEWLEEIKELEAKNERLEKRCGGVAWEVFREDLRKAEAENERLKRYDAWVEEWLSIRGKVEILPSNTGEEKELMQIYLDALKKGE